MDKNENKHLFVTSESEVLRADMGDRRYTALDGRVTTFPPPLPADDKGVTAFTGAITYPNADVDRPFSEYTAAEKSIMSKAASAGLVFANPECVLKFARLLIGNVNAKPLIWIMETDSVPVSHTHYEGVAEEYTRRAPHYTVTPVYPHRVKP